MSKQKVVLACGALTMAGITAYLKISRASLKVENRKRLEVFEQDYQWTMPNGKTIPTIFYQGMNSSQTQCAKYTGKHGFRATTGEHLTSSKAIDTIHSACIGKELGEVLPQKSFSTLWVNRLNPINFLKATYHALLYTLSKRTNRTYGLKSDRENNPESVLGHSIDPTQMSIGQQNDVQNHRAKYQVAIKEHAQDCSMIAYGVSRGAATTFRAMAQNNYQNIKLVILEGCPNSIETVISKRHPILYNLGGARVFNWLAEKCSLYRKNGKQPIDFVAQFPKDVPVLFISSLIDAEVPYRCTRNLAQELMNAGHNKVYFLTLNNSSHTRYMMDDLDDMKAYQHCVHALYKSLDLPHVPELASQGQELLKSCRL
jgi:hypothetical protein